MNKFVIHIGEKTVEYSKFPYDGKTLNTIAHNLNELLHEVYWYHTPTETPIADFYRNTNDMQLINNGSILNLPFNYTVTFNHIVVLELGITPETTTLIDLF